MIAASPTFAIGTTCKEQAWVMDQCWSASGVIMLTGDNGYMLFTTAPRSKFSIVGEHQAQEVEEAISKGEATLPVFGDFEICRMPYEDRFDNPHVCIERGANLEVRPLAELPDDDDTDESK